MADEEVLFDEVYELYEIIGKWVSAQHVHFILITSHSTVKWIRLHIDIVILYEYYNESARLIAVFGCWGVKI